MVAQAVFDTYELLEQIAINLHPFDIARLLRVSKASYAVVKRSAAVRSARVLVPRQSLGLPIVAHPRHREVPHYDAGTGIQFHRGLIQTTANLTGGCEVSDVFYFHYRYTYEMRKFLKDWSLQQVKGHFATSPPCQAVGLMMEYIDTVVYVKGGVRIKDLQEVVLNFMRKTGKGHYGHCRLSLQFMEGRNAISS